MFSIEIGLMLVKVWPKDRERVDKRLQLAGI
jgi:hypothetical protein